jgi:hypothetical protein
MRKFLLSAVAVAAIASPLALGISAEAAPVLTDTADCAPIFPADAQTHDEFKFTRADGGSAHKTEWSRSNVTPQVINGINYVRATPAVVNVVTDVPAVVGVTCVVAVPTPKVLAFPGVNNDQIYENPSETYVAHVTGSVTRGWGGGTADITYVTDAGYAFADGSTSKVVVNEQYVIDFRVPTVSASGIVDFGPFFNGAWKVGSKVTLTSGTEFQTHGGTDVSGPVTRYRLVFTPAPGFSLPDVLPGDGVKVSGSAVYLVYIGA